MKKKSLVSVAMAVYNGEKYIKDQIKSILGQTYKNIELIIIDDNSKDRSLEIISDFAKADNRIKVFRNTHNIGVVSNFLKGLSHANGDLICFSDQDDYWLPEKIELLKNMIDKDSSNMLAYSDLEICGDNLSTMHKSFWKASGIRPRKGYVGEAAFLRNIMPGCSVMFRKDIKKILEDIPKPIPCMHDHLVFIVSALSGDIVYSKERLVKYRQHPGNNIGAFYNSTVSNESIINKLEQCINYFECNFEKFRPSNFKRLKTFCGSLRSGGIFLRLSCLKYYLFLKKDTLYDKSLGFLECVFPGAYKWLRSKYLKNKMNDTSLLITRLMRAVFFMWTAIVFYFFVAEFVMQKISMIVRR